MNFKKGIALPIFLSLSAFLLIVIIGIAAYFVVTERQKIPDTIVGVENYIDKSTWKTYKSDSFGIELLYPDSWKPFSSGTKDAEEDVFRSPDFEIEKIDRPNKSTIFNLVHGAQLNIYRQSASFFREPGQGAYKVEEKNSFVLNGDQVKVYKLYDSTEDDEAKKYRSSLQIAYVFHGDYFISVGMFYREDIYGKVLNNIVSTLKFTK